MGNGHGYWSQHKISFIPGKWLCLKLWLLDGLWVKLSKWLSITSWQKGQISFVWKNWYVVEKQFARVITLPLKAFWLALKWKSCEFPNGTIHNLTIENLLLQNLSKKCYFNVAPMWNSKVYTTRKKTNNFSQV